MKLHVENQSSDRTQAYADFVKVHVILSVWLDQRV